MALLPSIKSTAERLLGCRIYRNTLPRGADLFFDLDRTFGIENFKTVFDIGANIGQSAECYLKRFPAAEVYSFEPVPTTYQALESLGQTEPRLRTFPMAMGASSGEVEISVHAFDRMSSILHGRPEDKKVSVALSSVADFCREHSIEKIDFMKIDTEGYEMEVLEGARPLLRDQKIRVVFTECEPVAKSNYFVPFTEVAAFLYQFKYELFGVYEQQPSFNGERNIFFFNPVFICPELVAENATL